MDSQQIEGTPLQRQSNRKNPELVHLTADNSELSSDDEDLPEVVNVNPSDTSPNSTPENANIVENENENENAVDNENVNVVENDNAVENENENENAVENENVNVAENENTVEMENTVETEIVPELPPRIEQPRARRPRHPLDRLTYYAPGQVDPANVSHMTATIPPPSPFTWPPPLMLSVNKPFPFVHQPPVHWPPLVNTPNPLLTPYPFSQSPSVNTPYQFPYRNISFPSARYYQPVYGQPAMPSQANWNFNY